MLKMLAFVAVGITTVATPAALIAQSQDHSADEQAIRAGAEAYRSAFNQGDAKALAAMWVEDGEYIDQAGSLLGGRDMIETAFTEFFKNNSGTTLEIEIESIKFLEDNVAHEIGSSRTTSPDGKVTASRYSASYAKKAGKWLMLSVHEFPPQSASNYERLKELEWLIGDWIDDEESLVDKNGPLVQVSAYWSPNRNFIMRDFTATKEGETTNSGTQRIGWHAPSNQIRSWTFDTSGGIITGTWQVNGDGWMVTTQEARSDGQVLEAIEMVTRHADGSQNWKIINRCLSGNPLPDESFRVVPFRE
jgi:uncharacterized protein (TIGR02246 family)